MNHNHTSTIRLNRLAVFIGLLNMYGLVGCGNGAGDAPPGPSTTKHDAAVRRDTSTASGGTGGTTDIVGTGGSAVVGGNSGSLDGGGAGGSTTSVPDAAPPRDVPPDLVSDSPREAPPFLDVGGIGIEVSSGVDAIADLARDLPLVNQDGAPLDASSEGLRDGTLGTQDSTTDSAPDLGSDVAMNGDLGPDLTPDTAHPDSGPDAAGPTCSNPSWAKEFSMQVPGWLSGDKDGNLFVANAFSDTLDLGAPVGTITGAGDLDALIVRLNPATGSPVWASHFGDAQQQSAAGVAVDKSGHVGFIGDYQGAITIGSGTKQPSSNLGLWPYAYVGAVQAADGSGLWGISANLKVDQNSNAILSAIAANPGFDDFVVCGWTNIAATDLVAGAVSGGGGDIVVAKIKGSDGTILWSRQIGGTGEQNCTAAAIDDSGNVVIAGNYNGQFDLGTGALSPAPAASISLPWIAKLNGSDGTTLAVTNASPAPTGRTSGYVYSVDTDSAGNVAIAGSFTNAITFGTTTLTSVGLADAYVAKFAPSLTLAWAKNWGDAKNQWAYSVAFDSNGGLTVVGNFLNTINIGPAGATLTASSDAVLGSGTDIFIARLDGATGSSLCALSYGDPSSQSAANVFVPRHATGPTKDATFGYGGLYFNSVLDFGTAKLTAPPIPATSYWLGRF